MSERIQRMKKRLTKKFPLSIEKFKIQVDSLEHSAGEPTILRRAKIIADVMDKFPILINEDELIVGNPSAKYMGVELDSGTGAWTRDELEALREEGYELSQEDEEALLALNKRAQDLGILEAMNLVIEDDERLEPFFQSGMVLPPWHKKNEDGNVAGGGGSSAGLGAGPGVDLTCIDWGNVMDRGLLPYIDECKQALKKIRFMGPDDYEHAINLRSMIISLEAVCRYARRYEKLAKEMAEKESNPTRKAELLQIAEHCSNVPDNRPRTFPEAMQMLWFVYLSINPGGLAAYGRFDQYMYPFYKADKEAGRITEDQAVEYLEALRLKDMELNVIGGKESRKRAIGMAKWHNLTIGGVKTDGTDATNDVSYLVLEALLRCPTTHHTISIRVADSTPEDLVLKGLECQRRGLSMPAFFGDDSYIEYFLHRGATIEDARDFCLCGCVDAVIQGRTFSIGMGMLVVPMILQFFLNDGIDRKTGLRVGHSVGDLDRFQSFEEFYAAFCVEMEYYMSMAAEKQNLENDAHEFLYPLPVHSALYRDGAKTGIEIHKRDYYVKHSTFFNPIGMINLGNSLYTIKRAVYEDHTITLSELKKILDANWVGHEDFRQYCLDLPKYGNGIEEVDSVIGMVYGDWLKFAESFDSSLGGKQASSAMSVTAYAPGGALTGATPDGRVAESLLADACASAGNGQDKNGPLALFRSAMCIPQKHFQAMLFNMKFHPTALEKQEDMEKLAAAIRVYFEHGGKHIQFNVVDAETLRDARIHPEDHEDLMVRVAGFSTYYTILNDQLQEEIINRTAHSF